MKERSTDRGRSTPDSTRQHEDEAKATATAREVSSRLDDILDGIDEVLEKNAEEFVRNYVQKGGE